MTSLKTDVWKRKGFSLLWSAEALAALAPPNEVVSLRRFFAMARNWQDDHLKSNNGNALVVAGLEGCLDLLSPDDAAPWLEERVLPKVLSFQSTFESDAALIFWLTSGKNRIKQNAANESYSWHCSGAHSNETIELGRILWGGAELDAIRILDTTTRSQGSNGSAWIGIYMTRLS